MNLWTRRGEGEQCTVRSYRLASWSAPASLRITVLLRVFLQARGGSRESNGEIDGENRMDRKGKEGTGRASLVIWDVAVSFFSSIFFSHFKLLKPHRRVLNVGCNLIH